MERKEHFKVLDTALWFLKQKAWRWKYQVFWFPSFLEVHFFTGSPKLSTVFICYCHKKGASSHAAHKFWTSRNHSKELERGWTSATELVSPSWCLVIDASVATLISAAFFLTRLWEFFCLLIFVDLHSIFLVHSLQVFQQTFEFF